MWHENFGKPFFVKQLHLNLLKSDLAEVKKLRSQTPHEDSIENSQASRMALKILKQNNQSFIDCILISNSLIVLLKNFQDFKGCSLSINSLWRELLIFFKWINLTHCSSGNAVSLHNSQISSETKLHLESAHLSVRIPARPLQHSQTQT